jgi:hypothetical protein
MPGRNYTLQDLFANIAGSINSNVDTSAQFEVIDNFVNDAETLIINESVTPPSFSTSTNYPVLVSADYPVVYWRLAESTGGVAFDSNQNLYSIYPRINSSSMTSVSQNASSFLAHAKSAQFTATASQIVFPSNSSIQFTGDMSVEFWINFNSFNTSGNTYSLVTKNVTAGGGVGEFEVYLFNNSGVGQLAWNQNGGYTVAAVGSLALGTWYHIVIARDGTAKTVTFYVNGSQVAQQTYTNAISTTTGNAVLGAAGSFQSPLFFMTEVALYAKPLTSTQASNHHAWGVATDALATAYGGLSTLYGTFPYPAVTHPTTTSYGAATWGSTSWK